MSMDAHAAGVSRPTAPPSSVPSQLNTSPPLPLKNPQPGAGMGGGLPADSGPDKTIGAAGPESVMRNCVCCEFVILPVGSLQGLPWVGGQQSLAHSPWAPQPPAPQPTSLSFFNWRHTGKDRAKGPTELKCFPLIA